MKSLTWIRFAVLAVLCLALGRSGFAQKVTVRLDPAETEIKWTLTDTLHVVHGTFKLKSGLMILDPKTGIAEGEILGGCRQRCKRKQHA